MPGRFFLTRHCTEIAAVLGVAEVPEEAPRENIKPGEELTVLTSGGVSRMRWGMIPVGRQNARGRPVMETIVNARSETVFRKSAYEGVGRAVVPVEGWYEWTGERRRKLAWRIRSSDGALLLFAAITDTWTAPGGAQVAQVATVTCPPSADVKEIHDRMGVLLRPQDMRVWLEGTEEEAHALCRPWPDGALVVEPCEDPNKKG